MLLGDGRWGGGRKEDCLETQLHGLQVQSPHEMILSSLARLQVLLSASGLPPHLTLPSFPSEPTQRSITAQSLASPWTPWGGEEISSQGSEFISPSYHHNEIR